MPFFISFLTLFVVYIPLLVALLSWVIHYQIYSKCISQWKKSKVPFLQPNFLIGHKYFFNLTRNSYLVSLDRIYKENADKDAVGFFLGTIPLILLRNPKLIQQVFSKNSDKAFATGWADGSHDTEFSQNMIHLTSDKNAWRNGRKTLAPLFSSSFVEGAQFDKIKKQVDKMLVYAREVQLDGRPANANKMARNFAKDVTALRYFGQEANSYEENGEFSRLSDSFLGPSLVRLLSVYGQAQFPGARWMPDWLKFVGGRHIRAMEKLLSRQIQDREQRKSNEDDLVDLLIALRHREDSENGKKYSEMSRRRTAGLSCSVSLLGELYFSVGVELGLHLLSLHPKYQDRIRAEVLESMRRHKTSELTYDVVQDLPFTHQVVLETARLYPNAPALMRTLTEDLQIPGCGYTFKKGDKLVIDPYSVQRDPKHYSNPETFDPERFSPENKSAIPPECFLSFGIGPRKCPGYKSGLLMQVTFIASLLLKYRIKPRSHLRQADAKDFHPRSFVNVLRDDLLIDLVPHETMDQISFQESALIAKL